MKAPAPDDITPSYRWYVLGILTVVYIFNLVDRSILAILQEPIKEELGLSDTQLGALTGLAFGLFYSTLAVPIAILADRTVRKTVVAGALALWSLATALCGVATNFLTLLIFRIGVGVGEAGGVPPSVSILSDYFPRAKRATAMAIYGIGPPLGLAFGMFAGGWLNETLGWRVAFFLIGIAGVILAPIVYLTVKELPRGYADRLEGAPVPEEAPSPSFRQAVDTLWALRSFRHLLWAGATHALATYSVMSWNPSFYIRVHELGTAEAGMYLALLVGGAGIIGTFLGGVISDRLGNADVRWYMWIPGIAMAAFVPAAFLQYWVADPYVSFAVAFIPYLLSPLYIGPYLATAQSLANPEIRSLTQAIVLMVYNIIGLSLGPMMTGALSDTFTNNYGWGADGLRYALMIMILFNLWSAVHFYWGSKYLHDDLNRDRSGEIAKAPTPAAATTAKPSSLQAESLKKETQDDSRLKDRDLS